MEDPCLLQRRNQLDPLVWAGRILRETGHKTEGGFQQIHKRPWSEVYRIKTDAAFFYIKVCGKAFAFEPRLTSLLSETWRDRMPEVLDFEGSRGWFLYRDQGKTLREAWKEKGYSGKEYLLSQWKRIIPLYVEVQRWSVEKLPELLSCGVPDRRFSGLFKQIREIIQDPPGFLFCKDSEFTREDRLELEKILPFFEERALKMEKEGLPVALYNEDFHDANIFLDKEKIILADWGESSLANPLCTLTVFLRSAAYWLELKEEDPVILELRDLYLEQWSGFISLSQLKDDFKTAYIYGMLCRALTWYRMIESCLTEPEEEREKTGFEEYLGAPGGWLKEFLNFYKNYCNVQEW